jgi:hypothetical protein
MGGASSLSLPVGLSKGAVSPWSSSFSSDGCAVAKWAKQAKKERTKKLFLHKKHADFLRFFMLSQLIEMNLLCFLECGTDDP